MGKEMLVSNAACKGCRHYGYFMPGVRCCNFCYDTGKMRPRGEVPGECTVKVYGNRHDYINRLIKSGEKTVEWRVSYECRINAACRPP